MNARAGPGGPTADDGLTRVDVDAGSTIRRRSSASRDDAYRSSILPVVHEFTAAWEGGDSPVVEDYLTRLEPDDEQGAIDLIYRAYCLSESDGEAPVAEEYVARFSRYAEPLRDLFRFHGACTPSLLGRLFGPLPSLDGEEFRASSSILPKAGDQIGPYRLRRELGSGSFARVFLAEQADLSDRLVVVKIAERSTREPWLMARARHTHIVEILSHAEVDNGELQLIAMPFWGGATFSAVLAEASRRWGPESGRRSAPARGADLLAALDAVAAPEYPSAPPVRPAREVVASLSYDRAIAWVVARLSEALDHADARGVAHGDVKPSNVLLSADGNPMLLDFNLARDAAPAVGPSGRAIDPGGTLAYMAPERLRALALACSRPPTALEEEESSLDSAEPEADAASIGKSAHLADLYSMGMVLLEALTGRAPGAAAPAVPGARRLASQAAAYAEARERPASAIVADTETASGRRIAPALRAILSRCLDPDPSRRYRRALELAEDLDRWRTDRPLAYSDEPFWGHSVPRWLRVRRRRLAIAAAWLLVVGLGAVAVEQVASKRMLVGEQKASAIGMLALKWDTPDSTAFLGNQRLSSPHYWNPEEQDAFNVARRALMDYGVIARVAGEEPGNWRSRDDLRNLPPSDRDDLEVWLLERAYRYARALADQPGAVTDWRQAAEVLDRAAGPWSIAAFAALRSELASRPGVVVPPVLGPGPIRPAPGWLDEHLLGFAAECRPSQPITGDPEAAGRAAVKRALEHYGRSLAYRPESFWGHYRAASAWFGLGRDHGAESARHLEYCLARRPENAEVLDQLAGRLVELKQYARALEYCDRGLRRTPRFAELYRTRVFARVDSGQTGGIDDDLAQFEKLRGIVSPSWWSGKPGPTAGTEALSIATPVVPDSVPAFEPRRPDRGQDDEIDTRTGLAEKLHGAGRPELALKELEKVLVELAPDQLVSRIFRAQLAIEAGQFDQARRDLEVAFHQQSRLEAQILRNPRWLDSLFISALALLHAHRPGDAQWVIDKAREMAIQSKQRVGRAHYFSAEVYAVLAATDSTYLDQAVSQLYRAAVANPEFLRWYHDPNEFFDPVRDSINRELARREDPAVVHRRLSRPRVAGR